MTVFILASCRKPELFPYTELVFKTLRIGFPTAKIVVDFNGDFPFKEAICAICKENGYEFRGQRTAHWEWILNLVKDQTEPFWICDTDIIFYDSVEHFTSEQGIAGWRIPEWCDEFTRTITRSRIHPSLMLINPDSLELQINAYKSKIHTVDFINPHADLYAPTCVALNGRTYFYDVCSMLYHAVGGEALPDSFKQRFCHINFGTISDLVLPHLENGKSMAKARTMVLDNPELGRGMWRVQEEYYEDRQHITDGKPVIEPISQQDAEQAKVWNRELCCGNQDAMAFCDLWHHYCHAIDDLIDTMEDGRPVMSKSQMISLFFHAAVFYNCNFFIQHRAMLFPIILEITNIYQLSVRWERSSQSHLRTIADVHRTCGNRMYTVVALLTGGEQHALNMSQRITERDWLSQHDENGQPT